MQLFCTYQESASFFPGYRAGTTLYDTKHCISNNQHTRVFSAQVYQFSGATQTEGDTLQTSSIFPLCTIVPVPSLFPTVQCAVLPLVSLVPGVWRLTCGWCRLAVGSIPPAAQLQHNRSPPSHHHPHLHHPQPATLVKVSYSILIHIIISDFALVGNTISSSLLYAMFVLFQIYRAAMVGPVLVRPLYNRSPPRVAAGPRRDAPWDAFPGRR